jgi:hypothetical protein
MQVFIHTPYFYFLLSIFGRKFCENSCNPSFLKEKYIDGGRLGAALSEKCIVAPFADEYIRIHQNSYPLKVNRRTQSILNS